MALTILHALRTIDSDARKSIRALCELMSAQRQFGHTIEVVTLDSEGSELLDRLEVPVHTLGKTWGRYGYNAGFVPWLKERAHNYDCVIIHGVWRYNAYGAWLALRETNVPYFVFTHGTLDPWFKLNNPFGHLKRWLYWPWAGYTVLRDAHAVLFLCDDERQRARDTFWLYDCHEFVVRHGISAPAYPGSEGLGQEFLKAHPKLRGKRLFTFFADHHPTEASVLLLRSIRALVRQGLWKSDRMRLVIADSSYEPTRSAALHAARRFGLSDCIYWTGPLSEDGKWSCLRASEVLLRPSVHETWAVAVAEALAMDTPVLISTGVAFWKDIVNEGAGFAAEASDEGFSRLIGNWIGLSGDERSALRRRARRCFENRYTLEGAANSLTAAIYLLIGVHRDKRWDLRPLKPASELP